MDSEQRNGAASAADGHLPSAPAGEYAEWARQVSRTLAELERRVAHLELGGVSPPSSEEPPASAPGAPASPDSGGRAPGGHAP